MPGVKDQTGANISILVRISEAYSDSNLSVEPFVDPWTLFESDALTLGGDLLVKGELQEQNRGATRKRRSQDMPLAPWSIAENMHLSQRNLAGHRREKSRAVYTYIPLHPNQIRLVHLLPGDQESELQGIILHVSHNSETAYRALSYVWGTNQRTAQLITPDGIIHIT